MRVRVVIATMLCLLVGTAARAQASEVDVAGDGFALTSAFGLSGGSGGSSSTAQVVVRSVAVCSSTGVVARCLRVPLVCPAGEHVVARYRGSSSLPAPPGPGWTYLGQSCSGGSQPVPGLTLNDFQRLPLPAGAFTIQPPGGSVLMRMPMNVYADTTPVLVQTTSLGQAVQVEATPVSWTWDFGDGAMLGPVRDPGGPYPVLTNSHTYAEPGTFAVVMTTTYAGRYQVDGGPWITVDGTAQVTSAPLRVTVLAGGADLVE